MRRIGSSGQSAAAAAAAQPAASSSRAAAASSSSAAAAAPAAPAGPLAKQPIPSKISNKQVLIEFERASTSGVLHGEALQIFHTNIKSMEDFENMGFPPGPFEFDLLKTMYKNKVYGKRPPAA
jgi:hypothetical protein